MADETSGSVLGGLVAPSISAPPSPAPPKPPDFSGIPGHVEVTPTAQVTDKVVPQDHPIWQRIKDFSNLPSSEYDQKYAADDAAVSDRIKHAAETVVPLLKTFDDAQPAIEKTAIGKQVSDFAKDQLSHPEQFAMGGEFGALGGVESAESGAIRSALEKLPGYISPTKPAPDFSSIPGHIEVPTTETIQVRPQDFISKVSRGHLDPKVVNDYRMRIRGGEDIPPASISFDSEGNITDADGRHRALAHLQEGSNRMPVQITREPSTSGFENVNAKTLKAPDASIMPANTSMESLIGHELAHVFVGDKVGYGDPGEIRSHHHPTNIETHTAASSHFDDFGDLKPDKNGHILLEDIRPVFAERFAPTLLAGGVAQHLIDNMPMNENESMDDDVARFYDLANRLGYSDQEQYDIHNAGIARTTELLNKPEVLDAIRKYRSDREPGLSKILHASKSRLKQFLNEANGGTK